MSVASNAQPVVTTALALGGGGFATWKIGPGWGVAIIALIAFVLMLVTAYRAQKQIDSGPQFTFDVPEPQGHLLRASSPPDQGIVLALDVANNSPSPNEGAQARNVHATLTFFSEEGKKNFATQGHWSDGGSDERDILSTGKPVSLDIALDRSFAPSSYGVGYRELEELGEIWLSAKREDRKLGHARHYCRVDIGGRGVRVTQWLLLTNAVGGISAIKTEPPDWSKPHKSWLRRRSIE